MQRWSRHLQEIELKCTTNINAYKIKPETETNFKIKAHNVWIYQSPRFLWWKSGYFHLLWTKSQEVFHIFILQGKILLQITIINKLKTFIGQLDHIEVKGENRRNSHLTEVINTHFPPLFVELMVRSVQWASVSNTCSSFD